MRALIVTQTDFTKGISTCTMDGVCMMVDPELRVFDSTHDIPPFDTYAASASLDFVVDYWPAGTVFVSVVDPGVGTSRRGCVARLANGSYVVTPDNGTLTHVRRKFGIAEVRIIDETRNRLAGSEQSYTFYGRDVYAYTGARLASGAVSFEEAGPAVEPSSVIELPVMEPRCSEGRVEGTIDVLDVRFGSLWTNIPREMFQTLRIRFGQRAELTIANDTRTVYRNTMVYAQSFSGVFVGEPLIYVNSLDCMAVAINQGSFAKAYNIGVGNSWRIAIGPDTRR